MNISTEFVMTNQKGPPSGAGLVPVQSVVLNQAVRVHSRVRIQVRRRARGTLRVGEKVREVSSDEGVQRVKGESRRGKLLAEQFESSPI